MSDVAITPQYRLVLNRWKAGTITIRQVELFVKTEWLTREQADTIYTYPRKETQLVLNDPLTPERLAEIRLQVELQSCRHFGANNYGKGRFGGEVKHLRRLRRTFYPSTWQRPMLIGKTLKLRFQFGTTLKP